MTYKYTGAGAYVLGIPARDLTEEEWAALTDEQRARAADLYKQGGAHRAKKQSSAAIVDTGAAEEGEE